MAIIVGSKKKISINRKYQAQVTRARKNKRNKQDKIDIKSEVRLDLLKSTKIFR